MSKTTMSSVCSRLSGLFTSPHPINTTSAATATTKTIKKGKPSKSQNTDTSTKTSSSKKWGKLENTDPTTKTSSEKPGKLENNDTTTKTINNSSSKKPGKLEKMVMRFKKSSAKSEFRSRHDIYSSTVQRLVTYKRFSMIQEILEHQKNFEDITNEAFTARLITLYGKGGMFDQARKLFDEMPDLKCPRTVYSFNALLSACIDAGRFDDMKGIVKDLRREQGITLDVVSYNVAIKGFCKMGDLDSADLVFDEMVKTGLEPNVITFNTLLNGFYGNGRFVDGERVWDQMVEMNVVPDSRSYNAKLHGLSLEKRVKDAVELLEEMKSKGIKPDLYSFNALLRGSVNSENLDEAKRWYGEIAKNNCTPDKMTYQTLVPFLCKKGDLDFAFEVCQEIVNRKWVGELLQLVVDELVKVSKIQEAEKLVQLGKTNNYDLIIL